ncbi:MAG: RdgB/HAM1 family non-canonical purine NTP pyrophosphatase [Cardiobacteriaceae bacterium]|nr:RdgB/HAM1 family non-canonical purine NTP pyrophosphatase [Cardiobacteriaceae bacterium]
MKRLILASSNVGKLHELRSLLMGHHFHVIPQQVLGISDAEETGLSFVENAILKARHAASVGQEIAIADDSGLCVPALKGAPGIYSARYSGEHGNHAANNAKLLKAMEHVSYRYAYYVCVLAYVRHAEDPEPIIATGYWHGEIAREPRGKHGFGYDPLFWLPDLGKTVAELADEEKNQMSHRAKALSQLVHLLETHERV